MRYQARYFSCGAATLSNVLQVYGLSIPEEKACKVTVKGTSAAQIVKGAKKLGFVCEQYKSFDSVEAFTWLNTCLSLGTPVILCVDSWEHWVGCVGKIGGKYIIVDSAKEDLVLFLDMEQLNNRWRHTNRNYAIAVMPGVDNVLGKPK